ncbi:DNA topoisomerase IV subunit A [Acetobacter pasteurianus]|uniref:DNA topoisomerase 4 subunit A n=1 Tax=Acetobacter pasteurianus (strain NBRC 105184 / IFO 3283-01) TaxID=634452 RepID=C7JD53_ACEP3|nr:DNA topoisomerase IV subunit A [Acetobacter pasteurianus]BAI00065.1 DNA topoisomerase IV subunit A [Acetobacter pasteurianus IFO 3283-01]BAI03118.1 DNA topoisomerase IV subunit A [Acetobacter pasteurianus IFO 3283-03]BAI06163.1 DNA topoisomerase IV subunit A [Acetobacter pasteurianus IFO 3283-07]BAI09213.1 DNA topoisomerase IV subunit A [Acetobacter pasteurianus IFO 3283-22]BAI12261.1 DNA topoisomerase IV subunit A [Acetobacter pasteurianus IFO 3283-26]
MQAFQGWQMSETAGHIEETKLAEALSERYLAYALSTIMSRSLPDVRDGLKPVHRRLVYAMHQLRLDPASGFKKCARVVGDVIGKFHPHGDASVYEALVRLAQDFAARYPLVEGQGNFGSVDGDNPAAMRYTEARLTEVAVALLDGIEDDAVDFRPTYDGEEQEPVVLPSAFPNLLANGAAGIAVGMATSIPPHNAAEVCAAAALLVRKPSATTQELLELMPGPDFPTGGLIVEDSDAILQAYETGRGSFRMRARWEVEQGRFGTWHIVVTQIPYQVQKSRLIEQIADLLDQKKLPLLGDIRDESTDEIRLVLEPKTRGIEPEVLMETLFRATPLESRFGLNMNVLGADRSPGVMGLKQVIQAWLDHRHEVLERRSRHRLTAVERRLEILSGFLAVYLNLDKVIRIIREEDDAKASLIATFKLTDLQAESVLNMRLRSLRRLEEMEIRKEHDALSAEKAALMALLDSEKQRWKTIERELTGMIKAFGKGRLGERRSTILSAPKPVDISVVEEVEREPLTMILSQKGWVRAVKGHNVDLENQKFKEGDALKLAIPCQTTDRLCFFATDGRAYTVKGADLPRGRGDGQPIRLLIDLSNDEDLLAVFPIEDGKRRLVASSAGRGMLVEEEALVAEKRSGRQVLNLKEGEFARVCVPAEGDHVAVVGDNRRFLIFPLEQLPVMARGLGVALQKYSDGGLRQAVVFTAADGLHWPGTARIRQFADLQDWVSRRAAVGKVAPPWAAKKS